MSSLALVLCTLIKKTAVAVYIGFAVFLVGWIMQARETRHLAIHTQSRITPSVHCIIPTLNPNSCTLTVP